eukprot:5898476-Prymnesium_polylepis.1
MGSRHVGQRGTASVAARSRAASGSVASSDSSRFFSAVARIHATQPKHLRPQQKREVSRKAAREAAQAVARVPLFECVALSTHATQWPQAKRTS